jgi:hypothetical protein
MSERGTEHSAVLVCWWQGRMLSCPNWSGDGATQMMSGEISNIFDNLRENSSELKSH